MEEMEVDLGLGGIAGTSGQDEAESIIIPDSGSSTEVEEDEDEDPEPHDPQLLMNSWAFSQRIEAQFRALAESPSSLAFRRSTARPDGRHQSTLSQPPHFMLRMPLVPQSDMTDILEVGGTREEESGQEERGVTAELGRSAVLTAPPGSTEAADTPLVQILPQNPAASDGAVAMGTGDAPPIADVKSEPSQSAEASQAAGSKEEEEGDTEGENCSICFEPWTTAGDHRLSTLRCGHLFGFSCIRRWLKGQGAKCPQCNKKAKRSDIVLLYAHRLRVLDNSEQESVKRSLEQEQSLRRKAELESAQCRLQLQVLTDECGKLRRQLQELKSLMAQTGSLQTPGPSQTSLSQHPDASGSTPASGHYVFAKAVMLSQAGGCRVLSYCEPLSCLLASQPSPQATLVPGCGVKKVSVVNLKACQYVPIHAKQIRGLAFNRQADSLLLSAALDNTVKLTSLLTNMVVQTYNAGRPVWSCCWCLDNNNYVFAGLNNGSVLVYDTRDTSTHVQELVPLGSRCPVASLSYVPRAASSSFPCGGLIAGSLDGACFWEQVDSSTYRPHVLPLETGGCTDIQVEPESRHCLVTYRPGRSNPNLRCVLMELNRTPQVDSTQEPTCFCCPVQTFSAGSSCKLLTKNAVFRNPAREGSMLVCAGDESSNSTMVWDVGSGALIQKLPADLPVLDICPFEVNQGSYLASLTEKMLKIYKWE